jgi:RNA polymerase sigma-70 factor (ECF subfamily)
MTRDAFDDLLDRSAPATREPLVRLVHWERFSIAEAAEVLGVPASTARGRYAQAKDVLRAALDAGIVVPGR